MERCCYSPGIPSPPVILLISDCASALLGRLWALADRVFAPYADYRRRAEAAGREIPIVRLLPRAAS